MKRIATALFLGSLFVATQAVSANGIESAIPDQTQPGQGIPARSTYQDAHANDPVRMTGSAIPDQSQPYDGIPALSTYQDAHANDPVRMTGSAIPDQSQPYDGIPARSTYADSHLKEPMRTAQPVQGSTDSAE
jgi:hypothetical protein